MKSLRHVILISAALAICSASGIASAQRARVGDSITEVGQKMTTAEGTWEMVTDGKTAAGYELRLNGKPVGYAVAVTIGRDGLPVARHADGAEYRWTGSTFRLASK